MRRRVFRGEAFHGASHAFSIVAQLTTKSRQEFSVGGGERGGSEVNEVREAYLVSFGLM